MDAVNEIRARRAKAADFDGDLPTVGTTLLTTAILEAGRLSLDADNAAVAIDYNKEGEPVALRVLGAGAASASASGARFVLGSHFLPVSHAQLVVPPFAAVLRRSRSRRPMPKWRRSKRSWRNTRPSLAPSLPDDELSNNTEIANWICPATTSIVVDFLIIPLLVLERVRHANRVGGLGRSVLFDNEAASLRNALLQNSRFEVVSGTQLLKPDDAIHSNAVLLRNSTTSATKTEHAQLVTLKRTTVGNTLICSLPTKNGAFSALILTNLVAKCLLCVHTRE